MAALAPASASAPQTTACTAGMVSWWLAWESDPLGPGGEAAGSCRHRKINIENRSRPLAHRQALLNRLPVPCYSIGLQDVCLSGFA